MATRNLAEICTGLRFQSSYHWNPHWVVGLSAVCFAVPSAAFLAVFICILTEVERPYSQITAIHIVFYGILSILYAGCIASCLFADYLYIRRGHRSLFGKIDIRLATFTFFMSILDFKLRASLLETALLVGAVGAAFTFSGLSPSFEHWVFRHSLWHVVAGAIATYGAFRLPPEEAQIRRPLSELGVVISVAYLFVAGATSALFMMLTDSRRRAELWTFGAAYADWRPVGPEWESLKEEPVCNRVPY